MPEDPVAAARALAPQILAAREEIEELRRLPSPIVQALKHAGLFQLSLPRSMGGPENDPITSFHAIEELSKADGSVGWCAFISSSGSLLMGRLRPEIGRELFGQPPDARIAGSARPEGEAMPVKGGFRVSGRWDYGSGINHANWLMCTCKVVDDDGPVLKPSGIQDTQTFVVPVESATIHDVWNVVGMRGTGSNDFVVDDVFVPAERGFSRAFSVDDDPCEAGTLFHQRLTMVNSWALNAANSLGMARGTMDAFLRLAHDSSSTASTTLLQDRLSIQATVGEAEAIIGASRAYALQAIKGAWEAVEGAGPDPGPEIAQARLAITHAIQESVRAVDLLFHAGGTSAIHPRHPLERFFRDIHVAVQHAAALPFNVQLAGQVLLGLRPDAIGW